MALAAALSGIAVLLVSGVSALLESGVTLAARKMLSTWFMAAVATGNNNQPNIAVLLGQIKWDQTREYSKICFSM